MALYKRPLDKSRISQGVSIVRIAVPMEFGPSFPPPSARVTILRVVLVSQGVDGCDHRASVSI